MKSIRFLLPAGAPPFLTSSFNNGELENAAMAEYSCPTQQIRNIEAYWSYLTTGKVPVGMKWLLDNISTTDELRPHLKKRSLARGYLKAMEQKRDDHAPLLHKHANVFCADLNGPTDKCLFLVLASYPTLSNDDRPMTMQR